MPFSYLINSLSSRQSNCRAAKISKRCFTIVKQRKTKIYILRRCVTMLLCWNDRD
ncbi:hypothetical protein DCAR_0830593 [Daucus carota subsp. sativus]|uniref:Uncharacterized protein n=1 Tax=Daucus carota subsp. sativus TaxID=79200 RepID=A0AAF0XQ66_DAUCS|nr:hypothetical protein DCAR_0830593 [Daucus carota subsp. sativus]